MLQIHRQRRIPPHPTTTTTTITGGDAVVVSPSPSSSPSSLRLRRSSFRKRRHDPLVPRSSPPLLAAVVFVLWLCCITSSTTTTTTAAAQSDSTTSSSSSSSKRRNFTKLPDFGPLNTNPYEQGCLYSYGLSNHPRTCNSDDQTTTTTTTTSKKCLENDLNYMEIRIHTGDWESITYESWILQILLSEILRVPTTIDSGVGNTASLNFYDPRGAYSFGKYSLYDSLATAYHRPDGDCVPILQQQQQQGDRPNVTCAHVIPESWRGTQSSAEIRNMVFENIIEPPETLGVLGLETWFITKFTLEEHPQFAVYLGLQGEDNRRVLAEAFPRPTTWLDYCTQVSTNNCSVPDNITQRAPMWNTEEEIQYYNEGNFTGHFRFTEENDCDIHPTTCTGHIADFPCRWDSFVQSQLKYLNIPLKSSGPEEPIGGYPYARLVELWKAANATKSNLIMHYWTPEPLVQEFVNSDAEFIRITMPPPSQLCADSRRLESDQCSFNETLRYGLKEGICEESAKNLYKLVVGNLYDVIHHDRIPEPIVSPAYDALRLFQISELQLGQIFDYLHKSTISDYLMGVDINTSTENITFNGKITPRDAVCRWAVENLDTLRTFVPRTYPRAIHSSVSAMNSTINGSSSTTLTSDDKVLTIITIAFGCIATVLVLFMWYMVHKNKELRSIKFAQIEFLYLLLTGLLLVAIGSILVALYPSNATCVTIIWFINFGYTLEFVPLIVKVAAVNKLIGSARRFRRVVLSRRSLFTTVFAISAAVFIYLVVWTIYDPPTKNEEYVLTEVVNDDGYTIIDVSHFCSSESGFWDYIAVGWNTLLLLCATVLAFQTRTLQKDFNESQTLAFLIYSHFVFVVLRLITVIMQQWSGTPTSIEKLVLIRGFIFSMDTIATILIYFVPKFSAAANKSDAERPSSSTMNNDFSARHLDGSSQHIREERPTSPGTNTHVFFESFHSTNSNDTARQSNRYQRRNATKQNEPICDCFVSETSSQFEAVKPTSQDSNGIEGDNEVVNKKEDSEDTAANTTTDESATNTDEHQDLSNSKIATIAVTSTVATADEGTKYTTILVGDIDESLVTDTAMEPR